MFFIISLLAAVAAIFIFLNAKKRYNKQEITFSAIGIVVASLFAISQFWTVIPAGHVGVVDFLEL